MSEIEVDEVLRLYACGQQQIWTYLQLWGRTMRDEAAEVSTHDAVPRRAFALVELVSISDIAGCGVY